MKLIFCLTHHLPKDYRISSYIKFLITNIINLFNRFDQIIDRSITIDWWYSWRVFFLFVNFSIWFYMWLVCRKLYFYIRYIFRFLVFTYEQSNLLNYFPHWNLPIVFLFIWNNKLFQILQFLQVVVFKKNKNRNNISNVSKPIKEQVRNWF